MAQASIGLDIKGVDVLKEVDELFKSVKANSNSIASQWGVIKGTVSSTVTHFTNLGKGIDNSTRKYQSLNKEATKLADTQDKIAKSHQAVSKSSGVWANHWAAASKHTTGVLRNIENTYRTLRTMASGGGGAGSVGQMAGQFGLLLGAPGAVVGGALATAITAIGFSVKSALDFRSAQANALGMGLTNPFALDAYGNYMTKYTGGKEGTAQLFGQLAENQATLGGPEFQQNFARRFGVNVKQDEDPKKLFEDQLRAEMRMAKQVRPELWKSTAQAMGVGNLVDIQRLWRFRTSGDTEKQFNEEIKNAKALEEKTKLDEETAKILNDAAKAWGALAGQFNTMIAEFSAEILKWGGKAAIDKFSTAVDEFRKWVKGGIPKTVDDIKHGVIPDWLRPYFNPHWMTPEEQNKSIPRGILKAIEEMIFGSAAHAGELTEEQLKIHKRWAGSKRGRMFGAQKTSGDGSDGDGSDALGFSVTQNADDKSKIGPYNILAAAKIPDNIQDIRDILNRAFPIGGIGGADGTGGGMGGNQGWAGAARGRGRPLEKIHCREVAPQ